MTWTMKANATHAAPAFVVRRLHHDTVRRLRAGRPGVRVAGPAVTAAVLVGVANIAQFQR